MGLNQSVDGAQSNPADQFSEFDANLIWIALAILISIIASGSAVLFLYCYWSGRKRGFQLSPAGSLLNIAVIHAPSNGGDHNPTVLDMNSLPLLSSDPFRIGSKRDHRRTSRSGSLPKRKSNLADSASIEFAESIDSLRFRELDSQEPEEIEVPSLAGRLYGWLFSRKRKMTKIRTLDDFEDSFEDSGTVMQLNRSVENQKKVLEYLM